MNQSNLLFRMLSIRLQTISLFMRFIQHQTGTSQFLWYGSKYSIRFRFNQQRAKLKPETLEAAFYQFDSSVPAREKTQTIVALPWMALPLLFSANLLFHLPNILFPRGIPWRDFIVCTWMHCDQSAYRGISLWTHQTSIRRQMGHRGIFPQAEICRLSNFHSCRPGYIKQEKWAKLIAYNMTETLINQTILKKGNTKYEYKVNFSMAANIPDWKQLISENLYILYIVQHKTVPLTTIRPFLKQM